MIPFRLSNYQRLKAVLDPVPRLPLSQVGQLFPTLIPRNPTSLHGGEPRHVPCLRRCFVGIRRFVASLHQPTLSRETICLSLTQIRVILRPIDHGTCADLPGAPMIRLRLLHYAEQTFYQLSCNMTHRPSDLCRLTQTR